MEMALLGTTTEIGCTMYYSLFSCCECRTRGIRKRQPYQRTGVCIHLFSFHPNESPFSSAFTCIFISIIMIELNLFPRRIEYENEKRKEQ